MSLDEIRLTTHYNRPLFRRAMSAWWQSTVPPVPFIQRAIIWAIIWFGVGLVGLGLFAAGYSPFFLVAGLIGAGVMWVVAGRAVQVCGNPGRKVAVHQHRHQGAEPAPGGGPG